MIDASTLRLLLLTVTSWLDRREREARVFDRSGAAQIGRRRLRLTDEDRRKLAARAYRLGRPSLVASAVPTSRRATQLLRACRVTLGFRIRRRRGTLRAVVVEQHGVWRSVETGAVVGEADVASRFDVREGRIVAYERFDNLKTTLTAAGLEESDEASDA